MNNETIIQMNNETKAINHEFSEMLDIQLEYLKAAKFNPDTYADIFKERVDEWAMKVSRQNNSDWFVGMFWEAYNNVDWQALVDASEKRLKSKK